MHYKVVKPSGKDVKEQESLTRKKNTRIKISDKKTLTKPSNEPPASLGSSNHCGKNAYGPQARLKQLESSPRNSGKEISAGVEQFLRHGIIIEGDKKYSPTKENPPGNESFSAKNTGNIKNKSFERLFPSNDASAINKNPNKNSTERTKAQKSDFLKKVLESKSKSYNGDSSERKAEIVSITVEGKKNEDLAMTPVEKQRKFPKPKCFGNSEKEISKSQSAVGHVTKKTLRRSEIPLLKTRQNSEKRTEVISLLMQKPVKENDSSISIELSQNSKYPSTDEFSIASELKAMSKAEDDSSQLDDSGEMNNMKNITREMSDTSEHPLTPSNFDSKTSELTEADKKATKASKAKTLDLEKVKTSSFTVLRAEGESFNRLESFHQQNLTAKETAFKSSKVVFMTTKASFSSMHSKKKISIPECDKGNKVNWRKVKRTNKESQESNFQKNSLKTSEATSNEIDKETAGKVGRSVPKRLSDEKKNKNVSGDYKSSSSYSVASSREKTQRKVIAKKALKEREHFKKNKMCQNPEGREFMKPPTETIEDKFVEMQVEGTLESPKVKMPESYALESAYENAAFENELKEMRNEEVKMTPRELASLVVTGTALNFDDIEIFEKQPEMNKIKLEIKIDVPSEDVIDNEAVEDESNGNINKASFDWLLLNKTQNLDPFHQKYKASKEKIASWKLLTEEFKTGPVSCTKVRSGLTRSCNRDEIFDDQTSLKLRRRNSEPYSLRGFIWKRADITSPKSLKPSVSSVASSLRHLNTDDLDDFIFWEAVPQKLTSCWEMSLYHFKKPWSVLSFSVFKDNRRSNTPGLILDTLRSGGMPAMRRPLLYQNDRINCRTGNIFDVEPSISQKNIDIRNWLAALNFTAPIPNAPDAVSESMLTVQPALDTKKQINPKRRNVMPQLRLPDKAPEKKFYDGVKNHKFDKWNIRDMEDLKELIRKESGSYVTKEQYILSEISNLRSAAITNPCSYMSTSDKFILKEAEDQDTVKETRVIKSVETSCQAEPSETQEQLKLKETPDLSSSSLKSESLPPEVNIWKYLFLFTLMFIIFHYSLGSNFVIRS